MSMRSALFIISALMCLVVGGAMGAIDIPLCGSANGFAGELNYEYVLTPNVETDHTRGEAIVLAVRPIPFNPNDPSAYAQAIVDAHYSIGSEVFRYSSGADGLLMIADAIPMGTGLNITIRNARTDGPTPFVFYTYLSNRPACFIDINPRRAFLGPIPGNPNGRPPSIYFSSMPPSGVSSYNGASSAFRFAVTSGSPVTVLFAYSASDLAEGRSQQLSMGSEVTWARPSPIYFEVRPMFQGMRAVMMRAVIEWRLLDGPEEGLGGGYYNNGGGSVGQQQQRPPQQGGGGGAVYNPPPIGNNNPPPNPPPPQQGNNEDDDDDNDDGKGVPPPPPSRMHTVVRVLATVFTAFGYALLALMAYLCVGSVYQYRIKGIRTFPDFIPHNEWLGAVASGIGGVAASVKQRATRTRGGYSGVNSADSEGDV